MSGGDLVVLGSGELTSRATTTGVLIAGYGR